MKNNCQLYNQKLLAYHLTNVDTRQTKQSLDIFFDNTFAGIFSPGGERMKRRDEASSFFLEILEALLQKIIFLQILHEGRLLMNFPSTAV